jgi:hypothetical protein
VLHIDWRGCALLRFIHGIFVVSAERRLHQATKASEALAPKAATSRSGTHTTGTAITLSEAVPRVYGQRHQYVLNLPTVFDASGTVPQSGLNDASGCVSR